MSTLPTVEQLRSKHSNPDVLNKALLALHGDLVAKMDDVLAPAEAESRNLLASEDREYRGLERELRSCVTALRKIEVAECERDETYRSLGHDPRPAVGPGRPAEDRAATDQLRALIRGEIRSVGVEFGTDRLGTFEARDLTTSADSAVVPTGFYGRLVEHMVEVSAMRQAGATIIRTSGGEALSVPKTTAHPSASIISEGGSISESDPTFDTVTLNAYKYAYMTQVTSELLQDNAVDLEGYLARIAAEAIGNASGAHFVTGDGSSKPNGIVTAATVGVTGATGNSGVPTADELIDLFFSVNPRYRSRGSWLMSDATFAEVRKLKDSQDRYLLDMGNGGLTSSGSTTLLGRPVVIDPNVADAATSAKSVVFGDISRYFIREAGPIRIEASRDYAFGTDLVTWRFIWRLDGDLVDTTGAVKTYQGGAS